MFVLYFKQAWRCLSRQKAFSLINVAGLALSLACCIVLGRYLHYETTAESHAIDIDHIMAIRYESSRDYTSMASRWELVDCLEPAFASYLDEQVVESSQYCIYPEANFVYDASSGQEVTRKASAMVADSLLLHFFDYQIEGDREAISRPDGCWISRKMLNTIGWTAEMAIGQKVSYHEYDFVVSGIFDLPATRCIYTPDLIVSIYANDSWERMIYEWFRVCDGVDYKSFNEKIVQFVESDPATRHIHRGEEHMIFNMMPWSDIYLYGDLSIQDPGDMSYSIHLGNATVFWLLATVLFVIFLIGMSNFVNLYRVLCLRRQHEQGVRRVFGQTKIQLFLAFWAEAIMHILLAVFLAWLIVELAAPVAESIMGVSLPYTTFDLWLTISMVALLPLLALLLPFIQSTNRPAYIQLKQHVGSAQNLRSRTIVLAGQYFITFGLLIAALWMQQQLDFLLDSPTGYQVDNILLAHPLHLKEKLTWDEEGHPYFESNSQEVSEKSQIYMNRLLASPHVDKVIMGEYTPLLKSPLTDVYYGKNELEAKLILFTVAPEWFDIFDIPLEEGVLVSDNHKNWNPKQWVVNKKALKLLGYDSMEGAFARRKAPLISYWGNEAMPVVGLVGDHYAFHRTMGASPIAYWINTAESTDSFIIRTKPGHDKEAVALLLQIHAEVSPECNLEYHWFRQEVEDQYKEDRIIAQIYTLLSAIAVLICCLGLLGLSLFDIRQRYREIAIRKAHGAHRKDLYLLLGKKYIYVLLATFALSIPITYLFIHHYTESFVESAPLTPIIYIEALGIVTLITVLTLIYQLERAARVNVASVMKAE